jgi:hypothetical protein
MQSFMLTLLSGRRLPPVDYLKSTLSTLPPAISRENAIFSTLDLMTISILTQRVNSWLIDFILIINVIKIAGRAR